MHYLSKTASILMQTAMIDLPSRNKAKVHVSWRCLQRATTLTLLILACVLSCAIGNPKTNTVRTVHAAAGIQATPVVVVPQKRVAVLLPAVDHDDILPKHRILADSTLRALPELCRATLKSFYVIYNNPTNRGLAGETDMFISGNVNDAEFRALIIHECGHIIDLGGLRSATAKSSSEFYDGGKVIYADDPSVAFYRISWTSAKTMRPDATHEDFVSGYAESDAFEDFAESFAFYILQKKEFDRLASKNPILLAKKNFIASIVKEQQIAIGTYVRGKKQPWDVTRLPYTWVGETTKNVAALATHASK